MNNESFLGMLAESPFAGLQEHMKVGDEAVTKLGDFLTAISEDDWRTAEECREAIVELENRADDIKNNIKSTAVLLGEKGKNFVRINYSSMILIIAYLSWKSNENLISLGVIITILIGINVIINKWKLNSAQSSNYYFRQNNLFGGIIFSYLFFI